MQMLKTTYGVLHIWTNEFMRSRKTLVFINSLGTDFRIWDGVVKCLGNHFNIVLHDKAGHGLSSERQCPATIADYATDLNSVLEHLKLSRVVLCGISVGGLIAQQLYQSRPDIIESLILSNTGLKIGTIESWSARMSAIEAGGIASISEAILERWFALEFRNQRKSELALYHSMLVRTSQQGYLACCEAIRDTDLTSAAKNIDVPVLCIGGEHDGSTPPVLVESMASHIAKSQLEIIAGVAHLPCIEAPEKYSNLITTFVETI